MNNVSIPPEEVQDPQGLNMPGLNLSRDPARTPMQWNGELNAGFSTGKPWLRIADEYKKINVEAQKKEAESMLSLYRQLLELHSTEPALAVGSYIPVIATGELIAFIREANEKRFLIVLNLSPAPDYFIPENLSLQGEIVLSTCADRELITIQDQIHLKSDEGMIVRLY
jgi:alpha-glucosidase